MASRNIADGECSESPLVLVRVEASVQQCACEDISSCIHSSKRSALDPGNLIHLVLLSLPPLAIPKPSSHHTPSAA